jgi:hypothetical protein
MRLVCLAAFAAALLRPIDPAGAAAQSREPFFAASIRYPPASGAGERTADVRASDVNAWRRDLAAIKAAGFNSITTEIAWADAEGDAGRYRLERFDALLSAADQAGLSAIVQVDTSAPPRWLQGRYPDAAIVTAPNRPASIATSGYCQDHPDVRAAVGAFITAVTAKAAVHPAFHAIDVWRNPGVSSNGAARFCYCPFTRARFREAVRQKYRTLPEINAAWGQALTAWKEVQPPSRTARPSQVRDWSSFFDLKLQEDLRFRADASSNRGPRPVASHAGETGGRPADSWLMSAVVDQYGATARRTTEPAGLLRVFDLMRSAAADKGWWFWEDGPSADVRLWTWAAISRGAAALISNAWPSMSDGGPSSAAGPVRLRIAGETGGILARNASLFVPLRPHPSRIAIVLAPPSPTLGPTGPASQNSDDSFVDAYRALLERNIQADFIRVDGVTAGLIGRYDAVLVDSSVAAQPPAGAGLQAFVQNGGTLIVDTLARAPAREAGGWLDDVTGTHAQTWLDPEAKPGSVRADESASATVAPLGSGRVFEIRAAARGAANEPRRRVRGDLIGRIAAAAGVTPEVRIAGADGSVEARFLESSSAMLLLAMNYSSASHKVTFTFAPDVPEAIWQNMETGAAVNFVDGPEGATYTHTFAPHDVLVLVRGKRLR